MLTNRQTRRNERALNKAIRKRRRRESEAKRQRGKHEPPPERPRFAERGPSINGMLLTGVARAAWLVLHPKACPDRSLTLEDAIRALEAQSRVIVAGDGTRVRVVRPPSHVQE